MIDLEGNTMKIFLFQTEKNMMKMWRRMEDYLIQDVSYGDGRDGYAVFQRHLLQCLEQGLEQAPATPSIDHLS